MNVQVEVRGESGIRHYALAGAAGPISIGRNPACSIFLDHEQVSREHARVWLEPPLLRVEDQSTNGTRAGDRWLIRESASVPMETSIGVGAFALTFRAEKVTRPAPEPTPQPVPNGQAAELEQRARSRRNLQGPEEQARRTEIALRREIHRALLEDLDLATIDPKQLEDSSLRPKVIGALRRIVARMSDRLPSSSDQDRLIGELTDEAVGLGPLELLLSDPTITEIMVVDPFTIFIERAGRLVLSAARFTDDQRVQNVIERIVTPLGRRIDQSSPLVDARLPDGSRVNAVIRPLALRGSCITIRKFSRAPLSMDRLTELGTLTAAMARFLLRSVRARKNIVISGGTGSGKTTLLNVLSTAIDESERIVTIEDAAELQLPQPHVVALETRPPNLEGSGQYTIRDLVKNALRMRPDRIVVGECRGGEALDMLQAMNTGHDGSLTTTHANSPAEAVARLETLVLMAGLELPSRAVREQISTSVHLIVQQSRMSDGTRKITSICELSGIDDQGEVQMRPLFEFRRSGTGSDGKVEGSFHATGYLPSFLGDFIKLGLIPKGEAYL